MQNVLSNSGELRLQRYLKNADSMGWVLIWYRYMTQQLLSVQRHLSFTLQCLCWLQVHVFTWCTFTPILSVTAFMFTITTTIAIRIHVYNNVACGTRNNPVSFQILFLDIFNMFTVSLLVILCYKSHQVVICSNFWRCKPTVMFSYMCLFKLGSCELYRFMSHVWRQSNCMTVLRQYSINFVHISLCFCGRINW